MEPWKDFNQGSGIFVVYNNSLVAYFDLHFRKVSLVVGAEGALESIPGGQETTMIGESSE